MSGSEEHARAVDPDLEGLVQLADAYGLEYDLVLMLAGQVVQGRLVGARTFSEEMAAVVQGADPEETLRGMMADRFRRRADRLADFGATSQLGDLDPDEPRTDDLPDMPEVRFVHLRDATVSSITGTLPLWRGRIADVVGWTLSGVSDPD